MKFLNFRFLINVDTTLYFFLLSETFNNLEEKLSPIYIYNLKSDKKNFCLD